MNENINYFSLADVKRHMGIEDELNDNILIYDFNVTDSTQRSQYTPGRANAIGIVICHNGEISININAQKFTLTSGMAAMILPGCIYNVDITTMSTQGTIFAVSTDLMKDMHINIEQIVPMGMHLFHNPCFHLSDKDIALYKHYMDMIRKVSHVSHSHSQQMTLGIISSLLAFTSEVMEHEVNSFPAEKSSRHNNRNMRLFEDFMNLLTKHFREEHQIGFYADKLCLTPKYLSLLIKQTSGRSVSDWIDHCMIMEAKTLLRHSDMSIQQIAYTLHFPTPSFFGTYFKRHTGVTPGDFRQGSEGRNMSL